MTRGEKIGALSGLLLQCAAPVFAVVALATHLSEPFAAFACIWNIITLVVVGVGCHELYLRFQRRVAMELEADDADETESVASPLTGHRVHGLLCDRCMNFSDEAIARHVSSHVLIVDDCPICNHIQESLEA